MGHIFNDAEFKELYAHVVAPFKQEHGRQFDAAIEGHGLAQQKIEAYIKKNITAMRKFHRKILELQQEVHRERHLILTASSAQGSFAHVIPPPSILSAYAELESTQLDQRPLSLEQKLLYESLQTDTSASADPQTSGPLIESAEPIREPTKFRISHDSETVYLGERNEWLLVKDGTNTNTLYAMHSLWRREVPIVEAVLRRASEFVPGGGAVHVSMLKTAGGAFRLRMESPVTGTVTEIPDREDQKREWSPRRFSYGGLSFVWKEPTDSPKYRKYRWETCYETKAVRPKEGSKSGKMVDEIVGPRLSWGEDNGGMGTNHTLYFASGLDQLFREHLLASHLARLTRIKFPPYLGGQYGSAYRLKALK